MITYENSMIYINIVSKNYICLSRKEHHIEPQWTSGHVYIGPDWEDVIFPDGPPLIVAKDFNDFNKKADEQFGSIKSLFEHIDNEKIKIYSEPRFVAWFILHFTNQMAQVYGWSDEMVEKYLQKTSERLWVYDGTELPLTLEAYKKNEKVIDEEDLIFDKDDLSTLPLEVLLLMWANDKADSDVILAKLMNLKDYFVGLAIRESVRQAKIITLTKPEVLKEFRNFDGKSDIIEFMKNDLILNFLFFDESIKVNMDFVKNNIDEIVNFFEIIRKNDLNKTDPFPAYSELQSVKELFIDTPEITFEKLLNGELNYSLVELRLFDEYKHKINNLLVADIVANKIEKG